MNHTIGYVVRATYIAVTRAMQKRLARYKMTSPQWYFMREIWTQEGLTQRELSERVGTAESTTVSALRILERRRLIKRKSIRGDRRASRVYLTDAGRRMGEEVAPIISEMNQLSMKGLAAEEVEMLHSLLAKVRKNLWSSLDEAERPSVQP